MGKMGFINSGENNNFSDNFDCIIKEEFTHSCAIGQTGCGKTTGYIYPNLDARIEAEHGILLYDYKGKEHLSVKAIAKKHNRLNDVIEVGKIWGSKINILKYMNRANLFSFFVTLNGRANNTTGDMFWTNSAANISTEIASVLKSTNSVAKELCKLNSCAKQELEKFIENIFDFKFTTDFTIKNLINIISTKRNLINFIKNMDELVSICHYVKKTTIIDTNSNERVQDQITNQKEIYFKIINLEDTVKTAKEALQTFLNEEKALNESTTLDSIITSMNTPLSNIAAMEFFNEDSMDIVKELNEGKIVVVNTNSIPENILAALNSSIFMQLTKRAQLDENPISIFIDEAQKVVSPNFELPVDVLRECKVELFLAFQNEELMITKLESEIKHYSFLKNLSKTFRFKNSKDTITQVESLEKFQFIEADKVNKIHKVEFPFFIKKEEAFEAELEYQSNTGIKEDYFISKNINEDYIYTYDDALVNDGQIIIKTKDEEFIVNFYTKELEEKALERMRKDIDYEEIHKFLIKKPRSVR